jgi:hypothetical protein
MLLTRAGYEEFRLSWIEKKNIIPENNEMFIDTLI